MPALSVSDFLKLASTAPVFDVRSPAEFEAGRLVGAESMALFSNEERALVGTAYVRQGHLPAVQLGLEFVGPKMAGFVQTAAERVGEGGKVGVYCWRGGMRSGSVGWLLSQAGFEVYTLKRGYKGYRRHVQEQLARPWNLRILGGRTGSGKTDLLHRLSEAGEQVIDLEGLAHHKGSAFGGIGQAAQPRIEQFENLLFAQLSTLDPDRPIWLEDESSMIGHVFIFKPFFEQMQQAPIVVLDTPLDERVSRLVADYASLPKEELAAAINRIARRMGPQHAQAALQLLEADDFAGVARLTLTYYDKAYDHSLAKRPTPLATFTDMDSLVTWASENRASNNV